MRWLDSTADQRREIGLRFWVEALLVGGVYAIYSFVRNAFGSAAVDPDTAAANADHIIDLERSMGLYIEADIQDFFIDWTAFIQFWNLFYGVFHFLVTFMVLIWLYVTYPDRYRFWRRAGLIATSSGLVGFAVFPLMPPRLLGDCGKYGACRPNQPFVDTVIDVGGIWSFESTGLEAVSNQYAAMPSLHIGWALWAALILITLAKRPVVKMLAMAYPFLTLFAIVVTANHYWIDGVGGLVVVAIGMWASGTYSRLVEGRTGFTRHREALTSDVAEMGSSVGPGVA